MLIAPGRPVPPPRLDPRLWRQVDGSIGSLERPASSYIYTIGQRDTSIYVIEDGLVKLQTVSGGGKYCILGIYAERDIFGESGIVQDERTEAAVALTPVRLRVLACSQFIKLISAEGLAGDWARYMVARLQEHRDIITLHVTAGSQQRLAAILLMLAARLGAERGGCTVIPGRFTHEDLSQMVGTTRSRIGLFLKHFRHDRLVWLTCDSHLVIDEPRLRNYLAGPPPR